ncbi:MAG: hypothetical protein ACC631_12195 [Halocynthiibacter sp.]
MEWIVEYWAIVLFGTGLIAMYLLGHRHMTRSARSKVRVPAKREERARDNLKL